MKENEMQISLFVAFLLSLWRPVSSSFNDVSVQVGISRVNGYLAALGDFNGDKNTDLFIVTNGGKKLQLYKEYSNSICNNAMGNKKWQSLSG